MEISQKKCRERKRVLFQYAILKHGHKNFKVEKIKTCYNEDQLRSAEIFFIKHFNSFDKSVGYNCTLGGEATYGHKHSEESKKRMSIAQKNISHSKKRRGPHSEETKKLMSIRKIGKKQSNKARKLMSLSKKGNSYSSKKIVLNGIKIFDSISQASLQMNIPHTTIWNVLSGKTEDSRSGNDWKYYNEPT